jgi:hypothetical protein
MALRNGILAVVYIFAAALSLYSGEVKPSVQRTVKVRVAIDEEFRQRPLPWLKAEKWVSTASGFFETNFGLSLKISGFKSWTSDNSKTALPGLLQNLYEDVGREGSDIVLGFTEQIRGDTWATGVASYRHGYALVKRMKNEYVTALTVVHELCHLFGAVDLEKEMSIMDKNEPRLECDEFTRQIVRVHLGRGFDPAVFPLSAEDMSSARELYLARKELHRREEGVPLMLTVIYLEMKDYEKAIRECREAEKLAPHDPMIQELLKLISQKREEPSICPRAGM